MSALWQVSVPVSVSCRWPEMSSKFVVTVYERRTTNYRLKCEGRRVWSIKAEWWRNMAWANLFTVRQQNYRRTHSSSREQIQIFIETAKLDAITWQYEWCLSSRFCFDIKYSSVFNLHVIVTIIIMGVFWNKVTSQLAGIIRRNRTEYNTISILLKVLVVPGWKDRCYNRNMKAA